MRITFNQDNLRKLLLVTSVLGPLWVRLKPSCIMYRRPGQFSKLTPARIVFSINGYTSNHNINKHLEEITLFTQLCIELREWSGSRKCWVKQEMIRGVEFKRDTSLTVFISGFIFISSFPSHNCTLPLQVTCLALKPLWVKHTFERIGFVFHIYAEFSRKQPCYYTIKLKRYLLSLLFYYICNIMGKGKIVWDRIRR